MFCIRLLPEKNILLKAHCDFQFSFSVNLLLPVLRRKKIWKLTFFFLSIIFLLTPIIPFPKNLKLLSDRQNWFWGLNQTIASALARPVIWINNNKSEPNQCDRIPLNNPWSMRVEVIMGKIYKGSRMEIPLIIPQKLLVTRCGTLIIGCL